MSAIDFEYKPLSGQRDFRLITLHPGNWDDSIAIDIEHACLDDEQRPEYAALSYVWGSQYPLYNVRCNNSRVAIGINLRDALRHIRALDRAKTLWIDRIAINQSDVDERGRQVSLMVDIFGLASKVIVWLGNSDENSDAAFRFIDVLTLQYLKSLKEEELKGLGAARTSNHNIQYPAPNDAAWIPVRLFLQRPWFSRVWTFQEIVLARNAELRCGDHTMTWNHLTVFLLGLETWLEGPNNDTGLRGVGKAAFEILKCRVSYHSSAGGKETMHENLLYLLPLLDALRQHKATDPRDKVFALLNLAVDAKNSELRADYSKSLIEVYATTARWLLRSQKSLAFLSLVEIKDKADLISWIPDFRTKDDLNFLHQPRQVYRGPDQHIYRASGSTHAATSGSADNDSLFRLPVRGILVGTIIARSSPPGNITNKVAIGPAILSPQGEWPLFAASCANVDGRYPPTGEPIQLAYQRTRVWDWLGTVGDDRRRRRHEPLTDLSSPGPLSYDAGMEGLVHGARDDIALRILGCTTRKRLFRTDTGYMGLVHKSVEVGDRVYVLMGGDSPFVLRPMGGKLFGFGGESYVHGIMDGEMLAFARAQKEGVNVSRLLDERGWMEGLAGMPWPFETEELILV